jgi:protein SCO1/2
VQARALWIAGTAAFVLAASAMTYWAWWLPGDVPHSGPATSAERLDFGGPFTLTDHSGRTVTERDFLGRHQLIFFGFTSCPAICPTVLQTVTVAMAELGADAERVRPLFVSVDPAHDTPHVMAAYVRHFDERIIGLTGSAEQIARIAKAYHVYYRRVRDQDGNEQIDHTAALFLMGTDGRYLTHIDPQASPRKMADLIRMRLARTTAAKPGDATPEAGQ